MLDSLLVQFPINGFYLSVNVFSTKVLIGDTEFYVSYWRRDYHFTWSSESRKGLPVCRAKEVVLGTEPATSLSAVKRSTDGANPAAVR